MSRALFDSNIVIDLLRGFPEAKVELARYQDVAISVITWIEVMAGIAPARADLFAATVGGFHRLGVDDEVADRAAAIR